MEIRRAKSEDASTLTEIAFAAKRSWGYPEQWIQGWTDVLRIESTFIEMLQTYAAYVDGQPVGFYALVRKLKTISLEHLWVIPSAMGRGIGRGLFRHAIDRAREAEVEAIEIESDPNAQAFYERMGARLASTKTTELDGQPRIVPVLIYEIRESARPF